MNKQEKMRAVRDVLKTLEEMIDDAYDDSDTFSDKETAFDLVEIALDNFKEYFDGSNE